MGNRRYPVNRETYTLGLVQETGDTRWIEKHLDLDRRLKPETPGQAEEHLGPGEIWSGSDALVVPAYVNAIRESLGERKTKRL